MPTSIIKASLTLTAAFLILTASAWAEPHDTLDRYFWARVVHVADGDTIEVVKQGDKLEMVKVRLYGLDAPEDGQAFGKRAGRELKRLVHKKIVMVEVMQKRDKYGRVVGIVRTQAGVDVGRELAKAGYMWVDSRFCKPSRVCRGYWVAVREAQRDKLGLWKELAMPPWKWR